MIKQDQFEMALKRDRERMFAPNPSAQPANNLFVHTPDNGVGPGHSKRDELWEAKKRRHNERSAMPSDAGALPMRNGSAGGPRFLDPTPPTVSEQPTAPPQFQPPPPAEREPVDGAAANFRARRELFERDVPAPGSQPPQQQQYFVPQPVSQVQPPPRREYEPVPPPPPPPPPPEYQPQTRQQHNEVDMEEVDKKRKYLDELKAQLVQKEQRTRDERVQRINQERAELHQLESYNPFGRGGCGAPLRDKFGNIITNRKPLVVAQQPQMANPYDGGYRQPQPVPRYQPRYAPPPPPPPPPPPRSMAPVYQPPANAPGMEQYMGAPPEELPPPAAYYGRPPISDQYSAAPPAYQPVYQPQQAYARPSFDQPAPMGYANAPIERPPPPQIMRPQFEPPQPADYPPPQQPRTFQPVAQGPMGGEPPGKEVYNVDPTQYVTKVVDPDRDMERKRKAVEMQKMLSEQVEMKKRQHLEEKKRKELQDKLEDEKIIREQKELDELYRKEQEARRKKIEDVQQANQALIDARMNQQPAIKPSRRKQQQQPIDMDPPPPAAAVQDRKNDLFGGAAPAADPQRPPSKSRALRKAELFGDPVPPVQVPPRVVVKETELSLRDDRPAVREPGTGAVVDKMSQTKIIAEISEKLKENINSQMQDIRQRMEEQQKHLIGELGNLKMEAKEAGNQKLGAESELAQLRGELDGRRKVEEQYDKQLMRALDKNYDAKPRPSSKGRALMSRGKGSSELKNYEKLFFGNIDSAAGQGAARQYPIKLYDKSGDTISGESSLQPDGSLRAESKLINLGCVDPNRSLYMPNDATLKSKSSMRKSGAGPLMNSKKAVDTLDFLDKIAGGAGTRPEGTGAQRATADKSLAKPEPSASPENSFLGEQMKLNKYLDSGPAGMSLASAVSVGGAMGAAKTGKESVASSAFNSMKLNEINRANGQRLEELAGMSKKSDPAGGDELSKLDNLLMDIMKSEKGSGKDSLKGSSGTQGKVHRSQNLDAIHEADMEDSLKGPAKRSLKAGTKGSSIDLNNLQLPTLKDSP